MDKNLTQMNANVALCRRVFVTCSSLTYMLVLCLRLVSVSPKCPKTILYLSLFIFSSVFITIYYHGLTVFIYSCLQSWCRSQIGSSDPLDYSQTLSISSDSVSFQVTEQRR